MRLIEKLALKAQNPITQIDMQFGGTHPALLPATIEDVNNAQATLQFSLPSILKEAYLTIGNGYFGPGYGLLPLDSDISDDNIVDLNKDLSDLSFWKPSFIAFVHWGCGIYSCMDLASPNANIFVFDGSNYDEEDENSGVFYTKRNIDSFLEAWVNDINLWEEMFS